MTLPTFSDAKIRFHEFYSEKLPLFQVAVESYKKLLTVVLADNASLATPTITGRVKTREECINKFKRKYLKKCEDSQEPYEIQDHITDMIGLRIVCLYESEVEMVRRIIGENFSIMDTTNKTLALESHDDTFGYKGLHLDLKLHKNRVGLLEYKGFSQYQVEVQIRTTVQDAWSVLDHKIKYKKNIPLHLKRRINRLAALFELADQEFENIRNETGRLESENTQRGTTPPTPPPPDMPPPKPSGTNARSSAKLQGSSPITYQATEDKEAKQPINVFSFMKVATAYFADDFEPCETDFFVEELGRADRNITPQNIRDAIENQGDVLERYFTHQRMQHANWLNPYTKIRHALYLADKERYVALLFDRQRKEFEQWLIDNSKGPGV